MVAFNRSESYRSSVIVFEFATSADKWGIAHEDAIHADNTPRNERPSVHDDDLTIVIGWDRAGRLLEVGYRERDGSTVRIIHAMKCRHNWIEEK